MPRLLTTLLVIVLLKLSVTTVEAQRSDTTPTYSLAFDAGAYEALQQRAGARGLAPEALAHWLLEYGTLRAPSDKPDWLANTGIRLTVMIIDQRGSMQHGHSMSLRISDRMRGDVPLGATLDDGTLGGVLERFFPGDAMFPGDTMFPGDAMFPGDTMVGTQREAQHMALEGSQNHVQATANDRRGFGLLFLITPDAEEFRAPIRPGATLFVGWI